MTKGVKVSLTSDATQTATLPNGVKLVNTETENLPRPHYHWNKNFYVEDTVISFADFQKLPSETSNLIEAEKLDDFATDRRVDLEAKYEGDTLSAGNTVPGLADGDVYMLVEFSEDADQGDVVVFDDLDSYRVAVADGEGTRAFGKVITDATLEDGDLAWIQTQGIAKAVRVDGDVSENDRLTIGDGVLRTAGSDDVVVGLALTDADGEAGEETADVMIGRKVNYVHVKEKFGYTVGYGWGS